MEGGQEKEIAQLRELVERDLKLTTETNRMLRQMRRSARWTLFFTILYWLVILGALGAGYYYVSPYIQQLFGFYKEVASSDAQSHNLVESLFTTFGRYIEHASSTQP